MAMMRILWPDSTDETALKTFAQLSYETHLHGGSGGVHVFIAPDGKRYTLKISTSKETLKDEVFADAVYQKLGIKTPACTVCECKHSELPESFKAIIAKPDDENQPVLFRLAEYIEPAEGLADEDRRQIIKAKLPAGFVLDCLLANHDVAGHWGNVLVDKKGEVWRVDNGSTLRFRALGEMQVLRTEVSELQSMKTTTEMMREVFGDIQPAEIQQQTKVLLDQRNAIIELFYQMHEKLHFDQPEFLLKIIVNRLQYLHEHVSPQLYPYSPSESEACLDYSGAGVFVIANKDGKPHALIGKRSGHDWWGSFGGASEERDLFLQDTAARESNEELAGIYRFTPGELSRCASHDLIIGEKQTLNLQKFRMYFVERPIEDISKIQDHEHVELLWVPVDAILAARPIQHDDTSYGTHDTLEVDIPQADGTSRTIPLHPPLALMLQQEQAKERLQLIAKGEGDTASKHHTRSRVSKDYPAEVIKDKKMADAITPMAEHHQLAKATVARATTMRGIAQRAAQKKEDMVEPSQSTQSDIHLKAVMGEDQFAELKKQKSKVDSFIKSYKQLDVAVSAEQERVFSRMLDEESKHPQSYVFYHAATAEIGFLNDLFTEFRRQIEHQYSDDYKVLRGLDDLFAEFEDVLKLMEGLKEGEVMGQERGLSVNPFLFGSDGDSACATYNYFLSSYSMIPPDIQKLFEYFTQRLHLDADFSVFENIFERFRKKCGGTCYQMFVDAESVDKVAYPAASGGLLNPLRTSEGVKITTFSQVMETLRKHPDSDYIKTMQARLYLKPEIFHDPAKVQTKTYLCNPPSLKEQDDYQYALSEAVGDCMVELLRANKKLPETAFARTQGTSLTKQMEMVYQSQSRLPPKSSTDVMDVIPKLLAESNIPALVDIFVQTPSLDLSKKYPARDYMRGTFEQLSLRDVLMKNLKQSSQLFHALQDHKDNPSLTEALKQLQIIDYCYHVSLGDNKKVEAMFDKDYFTDAIKVALNPIYNRKDTAKWLLKKAMEQDITGLIANKLNYPDNISSLVSHIEKLYEANPALINNSSVINVLMDHIDIDMPDHLAGFVDLLVLLNNMKLATDHNVELIVAHATQADHLYKIVESLSGNCTIDDDYLKLLFNHVEHAEQLATALDALDNYAPHLKTSLANIRLLTEHSDQVKNIIEGIKIFYRLNRDPITGTIYNFANEATFKLLIEHGEHAKEFASSIGELIKNLRKIKSLPSQSGLFSKSEELPAATVHKMIEFLSDNKVVFDQQDIDALKKWGFDSKYGQIIKLSALPQQGQEFRAPEGPE